MEYIVFAIFAALVILVVFIKGMIDNQMKDRKFKASLLTDYGKLPGREYKLEEFEKISHYYRKHQQGFQIDDITWNDLNLDEIFKKMNYTYSSAGEEYLYHTLRTPLMEQQSLEEREEKISYFMTQEKERAYLQYTLAKLGHMEKYSIFDYLEYLSDLGERSSFKHFFAILGVLVSIGTMFYSVPYGIVALLIILVYNLLTYFKVKEEIDPYIVSFGYIFRVIGCAEKLQTPSIPVLEQEQKLLKQGISQMNRFRRGSSILMSSSRMSASSNPLEIVMDYLRMTLHLDLITFNHMLSEVRKHIDMIDAMLTTIGQIDVYLAIGAYRTGVGQYSVPQFTDTRQFAATELYHPLIDHPVKNSMQSQNSVLLTGSNASGKSTFLKTVAINAILAQTVHTVLADSYESTLFRVCSSMALRDDVQGGESYYMVEIKAMKRIMDLYEAEGNPILCFVDEVLRGTNTVERIAASTQILQSLNRVNGMCFAATHDVELTHLLADQYDNYHFEESIIEDDIQFNYKLQVGRATTRNAIRLLRVMGYSPRIVQAAERQAEDFIATGEWNKLGELQGGNRECR